MLFPLMDVQRGVPPLPFHELQKPPQAEAPNHTSEGTGIRKSVISKSTAWVFRIARASAPLQAEAIVQSGMRLRPAARRLRVAPSSSAIRMVCISGPEGLREHLLKLELELSVDDHGTCHAQE